MAHFFVDREYEQQAFREALEALYAKPGRPQVLLFHGGSGMGKTWLTQQCRALAEADPREPLPVYVDCDRSNMTLEALLYDIHMQLVPQFKKRFAEYLKLLEQIKDIEKEAEEEIRANPENAQKVASAVSSVALDAIADNVPGAKILLGKSYVQKATELVSGGIATGITALRQHFASKKLKGEKYRLAQKDLQAEQARRFAQLLNEIGRERKLVLFIDRFEKLALSSNLKSDHTYYEYWHKHFLNTLSENVLVVQNGRLDLKGDYQLKLPRHRVVSFQLQAFKPEDIAKILEQLAVLREQMASYEQFVQQVHQATLGYPVAVGLMRDSFQTLRTNADVESLLAKLPDKETEIIEHSIKWFLDNNNKKNESYRETIYKLAICCTRSGKIKADAIKFILQKSAMEFPDVEKALEKLAQQYSFIDGVRWTMHELAREFILRHLRHRAPDYIKDVSRKMQSFYTEQAAKQEGNNAN